MGGEKTQSETDGLKSLKAASSDLLTTFDEYAATQDPNSPNGKVFRESLQRFKESITESYAKPRGAAIEDVQRIAEDTERALSKRGAQLHEDAIQARNAPGRFEWLTKTASITSSNLDSFGSEANSAASILSSHDSELVSVRSSGWIDVKSDAAKAAKGVKDLKASSEELLSSFDEYAASKDPKSPAGKQFQDRVTAFKDLITQAYAEPQRGVPLDEVQRIVDQTERSLRERAVKLDEDSVQAKNAPGRFEWLTQSASITSSNLSFLSSEARNTASELGSHESQLSLVRSRGYIEGSPRHATPGAALQGQEAGNEASNPRGASDLSAPATTQGTGTRAR